MIPKSIEEQIEILTKELSQQNTSLQKVRALLTNSGLAGILLGLSFLLTGYGNALPAAIIILLSVYLIVASSSILSFTTQREYQPTNSPNSSPVVTPTEPTETMQDAIANSGVTSLTPPPTPPETAPQPSNRESFEARLGTKWFSIAGVIILMIGVGFFINSAIEYGWITPLWRILLGTLLGAGLLTVGYRSTRDHALLSWGTSLMAGGLALMYFMIYASYHFPEYQAATGVSLSVDIILLILASSLGIFLALRKNNQLVLGEAFTLGYLTVLLGETFGIMTFIYLLVLALGVTLILFWKKWTMLGLLGLCISYGVYAYLTSTGHSDILLHSSVLGVLFFTFYLQGYFLPQANNSTDSLFITIANGGNALLFFVFSQQLSGAINTFISAAGLALVAVLYFLQFRAKTTTKEVQIVSTFAGVFFINIALTLLLPFESYPLLFALGAVVSFWLYKKTRITTWPSIGTLLIGASGYSSLHLMAPYIFATHGLPIFEFCILIGSSILFLAIQALSPSEDSPFAQNVRIVTSAAGYLGTCFLLAAGITTVHPIAPALETNVAIALLIVFMLVFRGKNPHFALQSLLLSGFVVMRLVFIDSWQLVPLNPSSLLLPGSTYITVFIPAIFGMILLHNQSQNNNTLYVSIFPEIQAVLAWSICLLFAYWATLEAWPSPLLLLFFLTLVSLLCLIQKHNQFVQQSIGVSIYILFCALINTLTFTSDPSLSIVNFSTPLIYFFSMLIPALGGLLQAYIWHNKVKTPQFDLVRDLYIGGSTLVLLMTVYALATSYIVSIGWSLIAILLIAFGFTANMRRIRIAGLALMSVVLLKVFALDLTSLLPGYRILSFILLGVLFLFVSFLYSKNRDTSKG